MGRPSLLKIFSLLPGFIYRDTRNIEAAASRKNQDADAGVIDALHQADSLAQIMVAPFGDCQFEIFKVWGDLDFLRTNLALLLPPFRDLAPRAYRDPQRFSAKGALATTLLFQRLFIFAYEHAYVYENKHLKLNERDRHPGSKAPRIAMP